MHRKMFRANDLWFLWIPTVMIGLVVAAFIYHYAVIHETVPWPGWLVSGLMICGSLAIVGAFYWERYQWVSLYAYTVMGVEYFYMDGAKKYLAVDVERDLERMLGRWYSRYDLDPRREQIPKGDFIRGSICIFRREAKWDYTAPGWWTRKVTGVAGWNWAMVGQGGKTIDRTAHAHEMAHIHLNHWRGECVVENAAHEIFRNADIP